jgi:hypothetical protein
MEEKEVKQGELWLDPVNASKSKYDPAEGVIYENYRNLQADTED